mgnify:CR=1 FL=1
MYPSVDGHWVLRGDLHSVAVYENILELGAIPRFQVRVNNVVVDTAPTFFRALNIGTEYRAALARLKGL